MLGSLRLQHLHHLTVYPFLGTICIDSDRLLWQQQQLRIVLNKFSLVSCLKPGWIEYSLPIKQARFILNVLYNITAWHIVSFTIFTKLLADWCLLDQPCLISRYIYRDVYFGLNMLFIISCGSKRDIHFSCLTSCKRKILICTCIRNYTTVQ